MAELLAARDLPVQQVEGYLLVTGTTTDQVGDLAAQHQLTVHELFAERASLEAAFMEMTKDSVEYHADVPTEGGAR